MKKNEFKIISFYKFKKILNPSKLQNLLKELCQFNKLKGTILIASEGINGTIGGLDSSIKIFQNELFKLGILPSEIKTSTYHFMPFYRLKVRLKKEIVTFIKKKLNVINNTAKFIKPNEWNKIVEDKNIYLIDIRNEYEYDIGTFKNAINPKIEKFAEFKNYINNNLIEIKSKKIAMFCTGGIRCEKASSYMKELGFKNLYQLKGGILKYLENIPEKKSKWKGECFLFDNRVSVKEGMKKGSYELCHGCRMPISIKDKNSKKFEHGVSCNYCFDSLTLDKKKKLRQRNKQISIAKRRGLYNPYIRYTPTDY